MEKNLNKIELKLQYNPSQKTYKIKIKGPLKSEIVNILKDKYKIEEYDLEINKNPSIPPFPINESIIVEVKEYRQKQNNSETRHICKIPNDEFMPIKNGNKDYYIKFSIDAGLDKKQYNKNNELYLTAILGVYDYDYSRRLYQAKFSKEIIPKINTQNKDSRCISEEIKQSKSTFEHECEQNNNYQSKEQILRNITTKIFGLINLGNTCFLNSSIQILIHSPIFIKNFLEDYNKLNKLNKLSEDTLIYNFNELIMEISRSENQDFSPRNLVVSFLNKCHLFSLGEQSDSQRFYKNFLTIIETELGPKNTCINDTFKGQFIYKMEFCCTNNKCEKPQTNIVKNSFYDIFVAVPEEQSTIMDLIKNTYRTRKLKSSKKCNKCGNNLELERTCEIIPNQYLSVNIQRANIKTRDLKKTLIKIDDLVFDKISYEPYAINIHDGKMDYGHYYR